MTPLPPGSTIGILGGGQLGRMLALAAAELGFDVAVYTPEPDSPAGRVAARETVGAYEDLGAVAQFAATCDVVTYEFENVPAAAAEAVARSGVPLRPGAQALAVAQDRVEEKRFARACGAKTVDFAPVDGPSDIAEALKITGAPALLKTRRLGYDGKGQHWVHKPDDDAKAWEAIGARPAILEAAASFTRELSLVAARALDGSLAVYDLVENVHERGILRETRAPAPEAERLAADALAIAEAMTGKLDYVGVIAIELFDTGSGLLLNEFAPRVHNTGHWTIEGARTSQFANHVRAVAGWPLASTQTIAPTVMRNLIGAEVEEAQALARDPRAHVHLYGKRDAAPGRKMGHVTRVG